MPAIQSMAVLQLKNDYPHFACAVRISGAYAVRPVFPQSRAQNIAGTLLSIFSIVICTPVVTDTTTPISDVVVPVTTKVYL